MTYNWAYLFRTCFASRIDIRCHNEELRGSHQTGERMTTRRYKLAGGVQPRRVLISWRKGGQSAEGLQHTAQTLTRKRQKGGLRGSQASSQHLTCPAV